MNSFNFEAVLIFLTHLIEEILRSFDFRTNDDLVHCRLIRSGGSEVSRCLSLMPRHLGSESVSVSASLSLSSSPAHSLALTHQIAKNILDWEDGAPYGGTRQNVRKLRSGKNPMHPSAGLFCMRSVGHGIHYGHESITGSFAFKNQALTK